MRGPTLSTLMSYLTREQRREAERHLAKENAKFGRALQLQAIPPDGPQPPPGLIEVWRSRDYLVQIFKEPPPVVARISINRTSISGDRWTDNISWDELQRVKNECGFAGLDAVEIYPNQEDVVNVANIRHLWVLAVRLSFAWRKSN